MMSQRKSAAPGAADRPSGALESAPGEELEKFMSAILTYLGFNVTKRSTATKYYVLLFAVTFQAAREAATAANLSTVRLSSGISASNTGLLHAAKAGPRDHVGMGAGRKAGCRGARRNQQRHGARRAISADPGERLWEFRSIKSMASSGTTANWCRGAMPTSMC